ncbi:hypothetical protein B5F07_02580 [Lachnoclostridium sp. An169]|uniref:glycosyltransferase family 2 protein n=1 Tax=Lachnoclostridium sp. An169 TaxID=1965569 RepID=UPI000B36C2A4|nr:glycosyltransferase family 2 protein [Lachnoclostridium sp. An169]OUP86196.1 hypothetical protein B5F07_02580 [Lachnoclostridium sp. An169]
MPNRPFVSVLIPVYNVEDYLERCLDSILNQTLTEIEVICVNDGSTDGSLKILEKYQKKDPRLIIVSKQNGGLPSARNAGLDKASGEYVGFVDSDDYVEPDMFRKLYETAIQEKSDVVICGANIFPETPRADQWLYDCLSPSYKKLEKFDAEFLFSDVTATPFLWRTLIRRSLIEQNHLRLQEDIMIGEDKAFQCKVYPLANRIVTIPDKLYNYFWYREGSLMNQTVYAKPEKKVLEHGRLIAHVAETVERYEEKEGIEKAFLEWSIPFLYDDFIFLPLNEKIDLSSKILQVWENCGLLEYVYELPEWKREMVTYFTEVSHEKKQDPTLSVIVPVDVEAEYLEEMLTGLLNQKIDGLEILLINNGTKNENYAILHRNLFKDKRIRLSNIPHTTYAGALNRGLALAKGEYITFLETSDWYERENSLGEWLEYARKNDSDLCGSNYCMKEMPKALGGIAHIKKENGLFTEKSMESEFQNLMYKRGYLEENKIHFADCSIFTGFDFLAKACLNAGKTAWYDKTAYIHRKMHHPDWISTDKCKKVLAAMAELMELAVDKQYAYLQVKICELINGNEFGKILVNNTRAFKGNPSDFAYGENSQIEVIISLMKIAGLVDADFIKESGYPVGRTYIKTLYEIIRERHKFLAELTTK